MDKKLKITNLPLLLLRLLLKVIQNKVSWLVFK